MRLQLNVRTFCRGSETAMIDPETARSHVHNLLHNPQVARQLSGEQQPDYTSGDKQVQFLSILAPSFPLMCRTKLVTEARAPGSEQGCTGVLILCVAATRCFLSLNSDLSRHHTSEDKLRLAGIWIAARSPVKLWAGV